MRHAYSAAVAFFVLAPGLWYTTYQMLQEREIEHANEYVAALAAHSSYWVEKDLSLFIARQIYLSNLERAIQYACDDEPAWLPIDHEV